MSSGTGLSISITPADSIVLNLNKGETSSTSFSVTNTNSQRIIIKLRSNAGKRLRIKPATFALEANQTVTLEVKLLAIYVDELIKKYQDTNSLESFRVQFNIAAISDLLYDRISSAMEKEQVELISQQWEQIAKTDIQQSLIAISLSYNSIPSTYPEERKSDESLKSLVVSEVVTSPEYKKLRTQYEAICVLVKRCQDLVKKQQEEKKELESKLAAKEEEVNTLKLLSEQASQSNKKGPVVKSSFITGITILAVILAFVIGFVLGQFAYKFMMK